MKPNKYGYADISSYIKSKYRFKETEKFIINKIKKRNNKSHHLLDIGCGNGNFINFASSIFTNWNFTGLEQNKKLFNVCESRLGDFKNINFINSDIFNFKSKNKKYDVIILNGVFGIFNEVLAKKLLYQTIDLANKNGEIYIISQFNNFGVDVFPKFRVNNSKFYNPLCGGWNIYSKKTIENWLSKKKVFYKFYKWKMPFKIKKHSDPIKSWTISTKNDEFLLTNGLGLIINLELLKIIK